MIRRIRFAVLLGAAAMAGSGCVTHTADPAATQPVTITDLATTRPAYWYDQPGQVVEGSDFQRLWDASEETAKSYSFRIERRDFRSGVMTTRPLVSPQWFEPWRRELRSSRDAAESSIGTVRRTIRFAFARREDGNYGVTPKVLVERLSQTEARVTSATNYRYAFGRSAVVGGEQPSGSREADRGIDLPARYWYPISRDTELEAVLARNIRDRQDVLEARTR